MVKLFCTEDHFYTESMRKHGEIADAQATAYARFYMRTWEALRPRTANIRTVRRAIEFADAELRKKLDEIGTEATARG